MFRPCIDLHEGRVKQIVGGTLQAASESLKTNFVSEHDAAWYAHLYRQDSLEGGHIIMLGPGNEEQALAALRAYPGGLQLGGGVHAENAAKYLEAGASHVIVTSWIFSEGKLDRSRLNRMVTAVGKSRLVLDLSCRKKQGRYYIVINRWQTFTDLVLSPELFADLGQSCAEFLVHAVDVEGLCLGVDLELVSKLAEWSPLPVTYAGGAKSMEDLEQTTKVGHGKVDLTIGSALDIFGGTGVRYKDLVAWNRNQARQSAKE